MENKAIRKEIISERIQKEFPIKEVLDKLNQLNSAIAFNKEKEMWLTSMRKTVKEKFFSNEYSLSKLNIATQMNGYTIEFLTDYSANNKWNSLVEKFTNSEEFNQILLNNTNKNYNKSLNKYGISATIPTDIENKITTMFIDFVATMNKENSTNDYQTFLFFMNKKQTNDMNVLIDAIKKLETNNQNITSIFYISHTVKQELSLHFDLFNTTKGNVDFYKTVDEFNQKTIQYIQRYEQSIIDILI